MHGTFPSLRCCPSCQSAKGSVKRCTCPCGGANHGTGRVGRTVSTQLSFAEFDHDPREPTLFDIANQPPRAALATAKQPSIGVPHMPTFTETKHSLFTEAENTSAFLKQGILGFQGSGKTKTATKTAIGLVQHMQSLKLPASDKPVYFIDTETGSDWVLPDFKAAGIPIRTAKTRAFSDLVKSVPEAEANGSVLLIDSITHFWKELCESYCRRRAQKLNKPTYRLQINDWTYLKGENGWGKFSDLFVNSSVHIILCGRAGYEFNMDEDDEGNKELQKTGVKMRAEGEFGYEPSLLVYMETHQEVKGKTVAKQWRTATILKDRSALIDGKVFKDPGFESFKPHIDRLNLGGRQCGVDTSRTTTEIILPDGRDNRTVQRKIVLDEIESIMVIHHPSTGGADRQKKLELLRTHFDASWTEIETVMPLERLRKGYDTMHFTLEGKHSRYHQEQIAQIIDDELPGDLAPPKVKDAVKLDHTDRGGIPAFMDRRGAQAYSQREMIEALEAAE